MVARACSAAALVALAGACANAQVIRVVPLTTNRIIYNPLDGMIYASVPGSAGAPTGNSITPINPVTAAVGSSVFVGSEPGPMGVSASGQTIYVGFTGVNAIRPFDTVTQTAGTQFSLGSGSLGLRYAEDIEVQPGSETVIAVSRRNQGFSPRHEGVAIFEDGVMRLATTPTHTGANVITFSGSPDTLYGYNSETTEYGFRRISVDSAGATVAQTTQGLISGFNVDIEYAGGYVYSTSGRKIDPVTNSIIGTFPATGIIEPDPANGRMYILPTSGSPRLLRVFDIETFLEVGSILIPQVSSFAAVTDLIRYGSDGLAFRTDAGQLILVNTALTNPAATGACCFPNGTCAMTSLSACTAAAGFWRGPDFTCATANCPPPGACCLPDGTCQVTIQALCGGVWSAGQTCGTVTCNPAPGPHIVRIIPLVTGRLIYNPADGQLYASIPATAGLPRGNTITRIDPVTAAVGPSTYLGSDPGSMAITGSGRYVYAGLNGSGAVRRYDTTTQGAGLFFSLGFNNSGSANYVDDIAAQPGSESTVAISLRNQGFSPRHEGVAIYDDGVRRPTVTPDHTGSNVIEFTSSPDLLLGYNNETTDFGVRRMSVTPAGATILQNHTGLISGFGTDIKLAGGFLFSSTSRKIDVSTMSLAGTYPTTGLIEPDPARGRVYILPTSGNPRTLHAYDINTFLEVGSAPISGITSTSVSDLTRWGENGLAFRTATQVVLITTPLVPPVQCYANCDNSTASPVLNVNDFTCFLNRYAAANAYANCDGSTTPPTLNVNDFTCFLNRYAAGCP